MKILWNVVPNHTLNLQYNSFCIGYRCYEPINSMQVQGTIMYNVYQPMNQ